jgi:BMFP domain-containing protein YqiC
MTQASSRIFDELGKLMNNAAGVADGVRREVDTAVKSQLERVVGDMDLVKREDYDALRELVMSLSGEVKALRAEIAELRGEPASAPKRPGPARTPKKD